MVWKYEEAEEKLEKRWEKLKEWLGKMHICECCDAYWKTVLIKMEELEKDG